MPKQRKKTPEGEVQSAIMEYLAAEHVLHFRMNTGAMKGEHNGKKWFLRFGTPGMSDVLSFTSNLLPVWIEVKAPGGKQSPNQKSFQQLVEEYGHRYILTDSIDDFIEKWQSLSVFE